MTFVSCIICISSMNEVHLENFDLNLLMVFEAVYETGNVGQAAERLRLTQPALSHALARLRQHTGDDLFRRRGRRMAPTPRAEELSAPLRAALAQLRQAFARGVGTGLGGERTLRCAMSDYEEWLLMPELTRAAGRDAPGLRIEVRRLEALFQPPEALRSGALEVAAGFFPDSRGLEPALSSETLDSTRNVAVGRKGNEAFRGQWTFEKFAAASHAAVIMSTAVPGIVEREMAARGARRRLRFTSPFFFGVLRAVAASDLIACLPEKMVRAFSREMRLEVREVPLEMPEFTTRLVWPRVLDNDPAVRWFRDAARRVRE